MFEACLGIFFIAWSIGGFAFCCSFGVMDMELSKRAEVVRFILGGPLMMLLLSLIGLAELLKKGLRNL